MGNQNYDFFLLNEDLLNKYGLRLVPIMISIGKYDRVLRCPFIRAGDGPV